METKIPDLLIQSVNDGIEIYPAITETGQPIAKYTKVRGIRSTNDLKIAWGKGYKRFVHVPCRAGLIALDIDVKNNRNGMQSLEVYCQNKGMSFQGLLKDTSFTNTPNGGLHVNFKYSGEPVLNNEILEGVEVKYSNLITAPGSISDKGLYEALRNLTDSQTFPTFLQDLLVPRYKQAEEQKNNQTFSSDITLDKIESVLFSQGHRPESGQRNRYAFNFSMFAAKKGKDRDIVTNYLLKYKSSDFPECEIKSTVKSAYLIKGNAR